MTRPISLAALTVLELTPPQMVTCAAEAGYSHVGIRLLPATPTEPQYDIVGDTPLLREVQSRLADRRGNAASRPRPSHKPSRFGYIAGRHAAGARLKEGEHRVATSWPQVESLAPCRANRWAHGCAASQSKVNASPFGSR